MPDGQSEADAGYDMPGSGFARPGHRLPGL
jgi:hypothetical protein